MNNFELSEKLIFTIDLDAFFASAEEQRNPDLKGVPMGVGHYLNGRGVVTTANYPARKMGITSGLPLWKVKKITKDFTLIESDYEYYQKKANEFFRTVMEFTDKVQVASIDECYVDVTHLTKRYRPLEIAFMIQNKVFENTGLGSSIGISTNILLSKVASNFDKPKGVSTLYKHEIPTKLWPLPVKKMHMIGPSSSRKYNSYGINTIGDLANLKSDVEKYNTVKKAIGVNLDKHIDFCNGVYTDEIEKDVDQLKSISKSRTFPNPVDNYESLYAEIRELYNFALFRCRKRKLAPKSITLSMKVRKSLAAFSTSKALGVATTDTDYLWTEVSKMLDKLYTDGTSIRYASVSFDKLQKEEKLYRQLEIGEEPEVSKENRLQEIANDISLKQGIDVVLGSTMDDNIRYKDKEPVMRDNVTFKRWDK